MKPPKTIRHRGEYPAFRDPCENFARFMADVRDDATMVKVTDRKGWIRFLTIAEYTAEMPALLLHSKVQLVKSKGPQ